MPILNVECTLEPMFTCHTMIIFKILPLDFNERRPKSVDFVTLHIDIVGFGGSSFDNDMSFSSIFC
jgi:hypothetical protein